MVVDADELEGSTNGGTSDPIVVGVAVAPAMGEVAEFCTGTGVVVVVAAAASEDKVFCADAHRPGKPAIPCRALTAASWA